MNITPGAVAIFPHGHDLTTTDAFAFNSGATAHVKGDWTTIGASGSDAVPIDVAGFIVMIRVDNSDNLIDIGIADTSSGTPVVLVENILCEGRRFIYFPLAIPKGKYIRMRAQKPTNNAATYQAQFMLIGRDFVSDDPYTYAVTIGADTGGTGLTGIDPGGSANTKSGWVQITASCPADLSAILVQVGDQSNVTMNVNTTWLVDIGIGSSGSERVIVPDLFFGASVQSDHIDPQIPVIPISIPEGTRIVARAQCSNTDATDRLIDIAIIGFS